MKTTDNHNSSWIDLKQSKLTDVIAQVLFDTALVVFWFQLFPLWIQTVNLVDKVLNWHCQKISILEMVQCRFFHRFYFISWHLIHNIWDYLCVKSFGDLLEFVSVLTVEVAQNYKVNAQLFTH